MHRRHHLLSGTATGLAWALVLGGATCWTRAQDAAPPAAGDPADPPAGAAAEPAPPAPLDPLVTQVLDLNPSQPDQLVRAVDTLLNLNAAEQARPLVEKLLAAGLDRRALAALADRFGLGTFLRMARTRGLDPAGAELARAVAQAADAVARSPERIQPLVELVATGSPEQRVVAIASLRTAGSDAAVALLAKLRVASSADQAAAIRQALAALGSKLVLDPARAWLPTAGAGFSAQLLTLLGQLGDLSARADLWPYALAGSPTQREAARLSLYEMGASLPSRGEAARRLAEMADELSAAGDGSDSAGSTATLWQVADDGRRLAPRAVVPAIVRLLRARQLAEAAFTLATTNDSAEDYAAARKQALEGPVVEDAPAAALRRRGWLAGLEAAVLTGALANPQITPEETVLLGTSAADPAALTRLLAQARAEGRSSVAARMAQLLRPLASTEMLVGRGGEPSELVAAAGDSHPRVRHEAVATILAAEPSEPFAGSSLVAAEVVHQSAAAGQRVALVADIRSQAAAHLAGLLDGQGYRAEPVIHGRQLVRAAAASPDVELIVLAMSIDCQRVAETLEMLRHDPRTARIPVVLVATIDRQREADRLAARFDHTAALVVPHDREGIEILVRRAAPLADRLWPAAEERLAQAAAAWQVLAEWGRSRPAWCDPSLELEGAKLAVHVGALEAPSLAALAQLPQRAAQRQLVDLASAVSRPLAVRQQAVTSLGQSVERFGVLLSPAEVLRQYDRYNASEALDRPTQQLLGTILDLLEARVVAAREPAKP